MTHDGDALVRRFGGTRALVVGDVMLDRWMEGRAGGLCREAPVPVVTLGAPGHDEDRPGGAANTAANLAALGAHTLVVAPVGADPSGAALRRALAGAGVDPAHLVEVDGPTPAKERLVADGQLVARIDRGGTRPPGAPAEAELAARVEALAPTADVVVASDYGYGALAPGLRAVVAAAARRAGVPLVVDAKDLGAWREAAPHAVKPNYDEAIRLLGLPPRQGAGRVEQVEVHAADVLAATGARLAAVTLDAEGGLLLDRHRPPFRTWTTPAPGANTTGAGDTFVAALALGLACAGDPRTAAEVASAAAAVVVATERTGTCTHRSLRARLSDSGKACSLAELTAEVRAHRAAGRRVVLTNGCFDLLHHGHVGSLSRAKALGDVLVVAVNSDASARALKGPGRPICPEGDRLRVLAGLSCVDHLVVFDGPSPVEVIEAVVPDVYAKGADYTRQTLPEAGLVERLGGVVHLLPYERESTTRIIERIQGAGAPR